MKQSVYYGFMLLIIAAMFTACSTRVDIEPNYEGIKMSNYGRAGIEDFSVVTGRQWVQKSYGEDIYQVPMFQEKGDCDPIAIRSRDGGEFKVDPSYTFKAVRGKGREICFEYKHAGINDSKTILENIENAVLDPIILNTYREVAREFTSDSILNHMSSFESVVEARVGNTFARGYFELIEITSGLQLPESLKKTFESKLVKTQQAEQIRNEVEKVKNELEVAKIEQEKARIEAETEKIRASSLTPAVLEMERIKALKEAKAIYVIDSKANVSIKSE